MFQWQGKRQEAPLANDFAESILFFEPEALALPSEEMEAARLLLNELSELVARVDRQQPWLTDGGEQLDRLSVAGAFTTYMTTGAWTSFGPAWREPVGRIVWAGTESSSRWAGFYEGAIQAGLDSATSIASLLS